MTYDEVIAALLAEQARQGKTSTELANSISTNKVNMSRYRSKKNVASFEVLGHWAGALGMRLELRPENESSPGDYHLEGLDERRRQAVNEFIELMMIADERDYRFTMGMIRQSLQDAKGRSERKSGTE